MGMSTYGIFQNWSGASAQDQWQWHPDVTPNTRTLPDSNLLSLETRAVEVNFRGSNAATSPHGRQGHRSAHVRR